MDDNNIMVDRIADLVSNLSKYAEQILSFNEDALAELPPDQVTIALEMLEDAEQQLGAIAKELRRY